MNDILFKKIKRANSKLYMPIVEPISWLKRIVLRLLLGFKNIEY